MGKIGGGGLIIIAILMVIAGLLIQSAIFEWLLDLVGWIIIIAGVVVGIFGLIQMFSGRSSDF